MSNKNSISLPKEFQLPKDKQFDAKIQQRWVIHRHLFWKYVWLSLLLNCSAATLTWPRSKLMLWLRVKGIPPGIFYTLLVFIFLFFIHNVKGLLKDLPKEKKIFQYYSTAIALAIVQLIVSVFLIRSDNIQEEWFLQLWFGGTRWLVTMVLIFVLFRSFLKEYFMLLQSYTIVLIANEMRWAIIDLKESKNPKLVQRITRIRLYLGALIKYLNSKDTDVGDMFSEIYDTLGILDTLCKFSDNKNIEKEIKKLNAILRETFSLPNLLQRRTWSYSKSDSFFEKIIIRSFYRLDGSFFFVHQIEKSHPMLLILWSSSFVPIPIRPIQVHADNENLTAIESHIERAQKFDLLIVSNMPIIFSLAIIMLGFHLWFYYIMGASRSSTSVIFSSSFKISLYYLLSFVVIGVFYSLYITAIIIYQSFIRQCNIPYRANPSLYRYWDLSFVFFFSATSIFMDIPLSFSYIQKYIIPNQVQILTVINAILLFFFVRASRTPRNLLNSFSDSLLVREFLRLLNRIQNSKDLPNRIIISQRLAYCKKLFLALSKRMSSSLNNSLVAESISEYFLSVNKHLDHISKSIFLGSELSRQNAYQSISMMMTSVVTGDYRIISEKIPQIEYDYRQNLRAPKENVWEVIVRYFRNGIIRVVVGSIIVLLVGTIAPELMEYISKLADVIEAFGL